MKILIVLFVVLFLHNTGSSQSVLEELDSVNLPTGRIILFYKTIYPVLSEAQETKLKVLKLKDEIEKYNISIIFMNKKIIEKNKEIDSLLSFYEKEKTNYGSFLLGLYSTELKTKKDSIIYDEKSIFWGAFKWGKKKNE